MDRSFACVREEEVGVPRRGRGGGPHGPPVKLAEEPVPGGPAVVATTLETCLAC